MISAHNDGTVRVDTKKMRLNNENENASSIKLRLSFQCFVYLQILTFSCAVVAQNRNFNLLMAEKRRDVQVPKYTI